MDQPRTILLVDDEPYLTHMLAFQLRQHGVVVHSARNGQEGMDQAIAHLPNLIICDFQMPKVSGLEMCNALYQDERTKHIPVIMLTGRSHRLSPSQLEATRIIDLLPKPFSVNELLARVRELLGLSEPSAQLQPLEDAPW